MSLIQDATQALIQKALDIAPDAWIPGGTPDPLIEKDKIIGHATTRLDAREKVKGEAKFASEFVMENMTYAAILYSTIAEGKIKSLDISQAKVAPGVVYVMTHENAPTMKPLPISNSKPKAAGPSLVALMQDERIFWNGQPIALILAETQLQADYAKSLIRVEYEKVGGVTSFELAKKNSKVSPPIMGEPAELFVGDAEKALAEAEFKVDAVYTTPRQNHNPIELHAVTLGWKNDHLFIHDASQGVAQHAWTISQGLGVKTDHVHVTSPFVGGGFGSKTVNFHHILAAVASKTVGRPVRCTLTREGVYRTIGGRTVTEQRVAIGARGDGHFTSIIHEGVSALTPYNDFTEPFTSQTRCLYGADTFKIRQEIAEMNTVANSFMRAPGEAVGTFALEVAIDELAEKIGLDPIELRLKNEPENDPIKHSPFSSRNIGEAYLAGADRFGWDARRPEPRSRKEGEWWIGMGCATATFPYYRMPGGIARITISAQSPILVEVPANDMGMGTSTTQSMMAAERFGVPLNQIDFRFGDSKFPGAFLAGGSSQTASIGAAILAAHQELVSALVKLLPKESPLHGLKQTELETRENGIGAVNDPSRFESFETILARAGKRDLTVETAAPQPLELMKWSMHSYGAQFAEVRVSAVTGEIRVTRFLGSFDCGRIINPKTALSQFRGGIVMGLGAALMEETHVDPRNGRIMNPNLSDYHVPVHLDVPEIDIIWTDIADPHSPAGARGIGEIGITGVAAAVANAVYNACGVRVRDLPLNLVL